MGAVCGLCDPEMGAGEVDLQHRYQASVVDIEEGKEHLYEEDMEIRQDFPGGKATFSSRPGLEGVRDEFIEGHKARRLKKKKEEVRRGILVRMEENN